MNYFLMHENKKLALFEVIGEQITQIRISNKENNFLPFLSLGTDSTIEGRLISWIRNRGIPVTRHRINVDLQMGSRTPFKYMLDNLGLSLTDHYWINPCNKMYTWEEINLYDNDFKSAYSLDIRDDKRTIANKTNFVPSASLKGDLKKKWIIDEYGIRRLVKGNYGSSCRQSISEVIASEIHKRQNRFEYTPYNLIEISSDNQPIIGCECPNFTSNKTEFISAIDIIESFKKNNDVNYYDAYINYCTSNGINAEYIRAFMEYQILTDFIITNTDRHLNNFGVIRDSETLRFLKPAPIFDSGNSMFYNSSYVKVDNGLLNIKVTSFKKHEVELLKYVTNPMLVNIDLLPSVIEIRNMLAIDINTPSDILDRVARAYDKKIMFLNEMQHGAKLYSYNYLKSHNVKLDKE